MSFVTAHYGGDGALDPVLVMTITSFQAMFAVPVRRCWSPSSAIGPAHYPYVPSLQLLSSVKPVSLPDVSSKFVSRLKMQATTPAVARKARQARLRQKPARTGCQALATPSSLSWMFLSRRLCCVNSISEKARCMASPLSPGICSLSSLSISILHSSTSIRHLHAFPGVSCSPTIL